MDAKKKTFYVSVQAGSILQNEGDTAFEFEIRATEEDVSRLQEMFDGKEISDDYAFGRTHIPWVEYHHDKPNDAYDYYLKEVYRMIHELGTPETKRHIENMHVLQPEAMVRESESNEFNVK